MLIAQKSIENRFKLAMKLEEEHALTQSPPTIVVGGVPVSPRFPVSFSLLKNLDLRQVAVGRLPQARRPLFVQCTGRPVGAPAGTGTYNSPARISGTTSVFSDMGTLKMEGSKLNRVTLYGLRRGNLMPPGANEGSLDGDIATTNPAVTEISPRLTPTAREWRIGRKEQQPMKFALCKQMASDRFDLSSRTHSNMGSTKMMRPTHVADAPSRINQEDGSSFET